jgi:hypothetical protein
MTDLFTLIAGCISHLTNLPDFSTKITLLVLTDDACQWFYCRVLLCFFVSLLKDLCFGFMLSRC